MPSYGYFSMIGAAADLVAYLRGGGREQAVGRMERAATWQPSADSSRCGWRGAVFTALRGLSRGGGKRRRGLVRMLAKPPANLADGPFPWTDREAGRMSRARSSSEFPGTDMPGHEVFSDAQINALADEVMKLRSRAGAMFHDWPIRPATNASCR